MIHEIMKQRIVDHERYPAFINHLGHKYILQIFKAG